jgi:hypothetical protein
MINICKIITSEWDNTGKIEQDIKFICHNNFLYKIGSYTPVGNIGYSIYFYIDIHENNGDVILDLLAREGDKKFIILMPSTQFITQNNIDSLRRQKSLILGLDRFSCEEAFQEFDILNNINKGSDIGYDTPAGSTWSDLTITFHTRDQISIKFGDSREHNIIREKIHEFCQDSTTAHKPNIQWYFLMAFAIWGEPKTNIDGLTEWYFTFEDLKKFFGHDNWNKIKEQKSELSKTLRKFFSIREDPIKFCKGKGYKTCINIRQSGSTDLKDWIYEVRLLCKA